jgi:thymidine phosphorylase
MGANNNSLTFIPLGIDTQQEHFVFVKSNSPIIISEGFEILTRIQVSRGNRKIVATLSSIDGDVIKDGQVSLSKSACQNLDVASGDIIKLSHLPPLKSLGLVRSKLHGNRLSQADFSQIIQDIELGKYSNIHIASFISACYGDNLSIEEITYLTKSMVRTGKVLNWENQRIFDKHCLGGLPGNRTTPLVVAIVAAAGLTIPKTSSRAITSPAGTADTMSVITNVDLSLKQIRMVVKKENGCISWGSAAGLSPVDDRIIKVERALDIDSEGQMIASILSKKAAVGSTHVVIDIPVGQSAKIRSEEDAQRLKYMLTVIGQAMGLTIKALITDGSQPVGRGIGPAMEARDILDVLQNKKKAPLDLREKSQLIAGAILELAGKCPAGKGSEMADDMITQGIAWKKFIAICEAQGGLKKVPVAPYQHKVLAKKSGKIVSIDNRKLAKVAKLAGAPYDLTAGLYLYHKLGETIMEGQPLYSIHSESQGEMKYALRFVNQDDSIFEIV